MPENAAHLERAEQLIQQWVAAGLSLEDLEVRVAAALAACAREARLEEAKWWHALMDEPDEVRRSQCCLREASLFAALERAVGEKGQPEAK